jgi:hypothetical protein
MVGAKLNTNISETKKDELFKRPEIDRSDRKSFDNNDTNMTEKEMNFDVKEDIKKPNVTSPTSTEKHKDWRTILKEKLPLQNVFSPISS